MEKSRSMGQSSWPSRASAARPHHLSQTVERCSDDEILSKHFPGWRSGRSCALLLGENTQHSSLRPHPASVSAGCGLQRQEKGRVTQAVAVARD